jgi:thioredoxin-like negative regulator of GroEL
VLNLVLAAVMQTSVLGAEPLSYDDAYRASRAEGKPLVVLVGADWCGACRVLKNSALPQVAKDSVFGEVAFTVVDTDKDRELAQQVMDPGTIPQLIMYHKTAEGWQRSKLSGSQSPGAIISFLRRGIQAAANLVK